jgi:hypothetical protein
MDELTMGGEFLPQTVVFCQLSLDRLTHPIGTYEFRQGIINFSSLNSAVPTGQKHRSFGVNQPVKT